MSGLKRVSRKNSKVHQANLIEVVTILTIVGFILVTYYLLG